MAYTVTSKYSRPSSVGWTRGGFPNGGIQYGNNAVAHVTTEQVPFHIAWYSPNRTFQVRYKIRRRLSPFAASQRMGDSWTGEDVWVAWSGTLGGGSEVTGDEDGFGPWQGKEVATDETASSVILGKGEKNQVAYATAMPFPYALAAEGVAASSYDCNEYLVQVRVLNASTKEVSEWAEQVIRVAYVPIANSVSAELLEDGSAHVEIDTNWTRSGGRFNATWPCSVTQWSGGAPAKTSVIEPRFEAVFPVELPEEGDVVGIAFDVPENYIEDDGTGGSAIWFVTMDYMTDDMNLRYGVLDGLLAGSRYGVPITEHVEPAGIPDPIVTIGADGTVTVRADGGGEYNNVLTRLYWKDEEGRSYLLNLDMEEQQDGSWVGSVEAPPLGVNIGVRTTVVDDNGRWKTVRAEHTVDSDAKIMLDHGDQHFELIWNFARTFEYTPDAESVKVAGRRLPVVRFSESTTREIEVTGRMVNPAVYPQLGTMWLKDADKLDSSHTWMLRTLGGLRRLVYIKAVSIRMGSPVAEVFADVTLSCEEVS